MAVPHANGQDLPPLVLQAALCAAPSTFLGILAWLVFLVLQLFDIDARQLLPIPVLLLLPFATFYFTRLCARSGLINRDASPLAISIAIGVATAAVLWFMPTLDAWFGDTSPAVMVGIVFAAGAVALALFPRDDPA